MEKMTYVTENGMVLFTPPETDSDTGYTITGLASKGKYMYLEEIAHHMANIEQRLQKYLDTNLTPEQIKEFPSAAELAEIVAGLMKLKKYQEIGTVEECRGAVEKKNHNVKDLNATDFSNLLTNIVFTLKDTVIKALEENDTEVLRDEIYYYMQECQQEG